jgi:hypothetical protein
MRKRRFSDEQMVAILREAHRTTVLRKYRRRALRREFFNKPYAIAALVRANIRDARRPRSI